MKKATIAIMILLCGCSLNENTQKEAFTERIKSNVKEYHEDKLNDPLSYEFVSIDFIDTITNEENINKLRRNTIGLMELTESLIQDYQSYKEINSPLYSESKLKNNQAELLEYQNRLSKIDSIMGGQKDISEQNAAYIIDFKFRAKNAFGALVINDFYFLILNDSNLSIQKMTRELDEVYDTNLENSLYQSLY